MRPEDVVREGRSITSRVNHDIGADTRREAAETTLVPSLGMAGECPAWMCISTQPTLAKEAHSPSLDDEPWTVGEVDYVAAHWNDLPNSVAKALGRTPGCIKRKRAAMNRLFPAAFPLVRGRNGHEARRVVPLVK